MPMFTTGLRQLAFETRGFSLPFRRSNRSHTEETELAGTTYVTMFVTVFGCAFVLLEFSTFTRALFRVISIRNQLVSILDPFFPFTLWDATCILY
ncbi:hypothetical protein Hdeb2414_s0003g00100681 [Helianthus debilis subsp. tardiflorus]